MLGVTDLATYIVGTILIILLPGPNSLYVLSVAARRGVRAGYQGAAGVVVGDSVLMVLAAVGVGTLLKANPALFLVLKLAGAAYLAWMGAKLILGAVRGLRSGALRAESTPADMSNPFRRAFAICMVNPKAILFFVSFFIQFIDPHYAYPALTVIVLGAMLHVVSIIYLSVLIFAGSRIAGAFRQRARLSSAMTGAVGALFIGFGARLATATVE
jgi:leucine efflux protein